MEKNLVMESNGNVRKKNSHGNGRTIQSWKFKKVMEKSWNFSTAYRESRMGNSENSISRELLQCFGYDRVSVYLY